MTQPEPATVEDLLRAFGRGGADDVAALCRVSRNAVTRLFDHAGNPVGYNLPTPVMVLRLCVKLKVSRAAFASIMEDLAHMQEARRSMNDMNYRPCLPRRKHYSMERP